MYVVGDTHGEYYKLKNVIEQVLTEHSNASFCFLGDYVDRGLYSYEVIDYLLNLRKTNKCIFLKGNHK